MANKISLELEQGEVIHWKNVDREIKSYREWMVEDGPKYDAIAARIATGRERLEAAQAGGDVAVIQAVTDKLEELETSIENANFVCKRMFAIRGFLYLRSVIGEGSFTVTVDDFKFAIQ